jgi:hypothetical protein
MDGSPLGLVVDFDDCTLLEIIVVLQRRSEVVNASK